MEAAFKELKAVTAANTERIEEREKVGTASGSEESGARVSASVLPDLVLVVSNEVALGFPPPPPGETDANMDINDATDEFSSVCICIYIYI